MVPWIAVAIVGTSHGAYLRRFSRELQRSKIPAPVEFVGVSALVYFDFGMLFEAFGFPYQSSYFRPFFNASSTTIVLAVALIALAPWVMRGGAGQSPSYDLYPMRYLRCGWRKVCFYFAATTFCAACVAVPLAITQSGVPVWESRYLLGELMGPWILVLSLPMCLLAFYLCLRDARTRFGMGFTAFLLVSSILATMAIGQRTMVLLPVMMVLLFGPRISWKRWIVATCAAAVAAALLLPMFKSTYGDNSPSQSSLFNDTITNDFYRAPELATTMGMTSLIGKRIGYSGSGYVYASLLFVPRAIAPMKGNSSASDFTGAVMQCAPGTLSWGFGISAISEALLNFGFLLALPVLWFYGRSFGWLTRKSRKWQSLRIPLCFAALWVFGYHLAALLALFGTMSLLGVAAEVMFAAPAIGSELATANSGDRL